VLPAQVPFADAVANVQRTAVLVAALAAGRTDGAERLLSDASRDRLHQPYRARLVPGMGAAIDAARSAGAAAAFLSGAGPTVLALITRPELAAAVGGAACAAFAAEGVTAEPRLLDQESGGARLVP
jgi:homoserine kinase